MLGFLCMMDQCETCEVKFDSIEFVISFVHGANDQIQGRRLCDYLVTIRSGIGNRAWILIGDFNVLSCPMQCLRFDGNMCSSADIREVCDCLEHIGVFDHVFAGAKFT